MASVLSSFFGSLIQTCLPQQDLVVNGRRLKIVRKLAEGGFGYVYQARDVRDVAAASEAASAVDGPDDDGDEMVAVKIMISQSAEQRVLFRREIETHLRLSGVKHVAPLLDHAFLRENEGSDLLGFYRSTALPGATPPASSSSHERAVLVFPFYRHGSMQDVLNTRLAASNTTSSSSIRGFFDAHTALRFAVAVGEALEEMHARGLAHRDVCPRNIMIASKRDAKPQELAADAARGSWSSFEPVLIDFGSAVPATVEIKDRGDALRLQEEASTHSSMPYRAPELFEPAVPSTVDGRVDVFSLGASLYAMVFGLSPFESECAVGGGLRIADPSHSRTLSAVQFPTKGKWGDAASSEALFSDAFKGLLSYALEKDCSKRPTMTQWLERARAAAAALAPRSTAPPTISPGAAPTASA